MLGLVGLEEWEIILILAVVLILFGARRLPWLARDLGEGISAFRKATREVRDEMDDAASDAGRSAGGIYGKPAAEALSPDNQVAELYDPAVLRGANGPRRGWMSRGFLRFCWWISRILLGIVGRRRE